MPTILVVDDRPINRELLVTLLGYQGHTLIEASDGAEALARVHADRPDLVIADILMPTMDGFEFVRQLRADPAIAGTPVIFFSAHYLEREAKSLAERCGVSHVIVKPAEPETILATVTQALGLQAPPVPPAITGEFDREHLRLITDTLSQKADQLEATNRRLAALIELGQQLASEHDPARLLEDFCHAARSIMGAKYAAVAIVGLSGREIDQFLTSGMDAEMVAKISSLSGEQRLPSVLMRESSPLWIRDVASDPRTAELAKNYPPMSSLLGTRIASPTRLYGSLWVADKLGAPGFTAEEERLAATLAAQVAVAYENVLRYDQIQSHALQLEQEMAERQRAQDEIRRLNVDLERRVADRTRELEESHQRLRLSERMASIGTLSAGLGHDMGNMLLPIRARLDVMEASGMPRGFQEHVEAIRQCAEYLQSLTNGLRLLALDPEDADASGGSTALDRWASDATALLKNTLPKGIVLERRIPPGLPAVGIAPHRLTQAVLNLVNNAGDALRGHGEGRVIVWAETAADARTLRLGVTDNGPGMAPEVRRRALEPFFTTKTRRLSTGLGLSLVHGIVTAAGGSVEIDSEPGRGTTVLLTLPALAPPQSAGAGPGQGRSAELRVASVCVEDKRMGAVIAALLGSMGFEVRQTRTPDTDDATLWVTEGSAQALAGARAFLDAGPARRIVLVGTPSPEWHKIGVLALDPTLRPGVLRETLYAAARGGAPPRRPEPALAMPADPVEHDAVHPGT